MADKVRRVLHIYLAAFLHPMSNCSVPALVHKSADGIQGMTIKVIKVKP
jgi:hypothetical protein